MNLSESLLPEFDLEFANTRLALERIPEEAFDWRPHEKSWTMIELVTHIANLPSWTVITIKQETYDINPKGGGQPTAPELTSVDEVLKTFDENLSQARTALVETNDTILQGNWSLLSAGNPVLTMPRINLIRSFVMNHNIHHRAQLGVYLRLNNQPVPAFYGPTADEASTF